MNPTTTRTTPTPTTAYLSLSVILPIFPFTMIDTSVMELKTKKGKGKEDFKD
jgi:hypothetical protein